MARQSKVGLTKSQLDMRGVQVTIMVHIGEWSKYVAISPVNYEVFKQWPEIYADRVISSIVSSIENELNKGVSDGKDV